MRSFCDALKFWSTQNSKNENSNLMTNALAQQMADAAAITYSLRMYYNVQILPSHSDKSVF